MRNSGHHHNGTNLVGKEIETLVPLAPPSAPNGAAGPGHDWGNPVGLVVNNQCVSSSIVILVSSCSHFLYSHYCLPYLHSRALAARSRISGRPRGQNVKSTYRLRYQ